MSQMQPTQPTQQGAGWSGLVEGWVDFVKGPAGIVAGIMALLALVGTGVTLANASWARTYWLILVPIYGALCVFVAWRRTGQFTGTVMRQILHWLSVAAAMALDFAYLHGTGEQTATATGLSSLLVLALGCALAGIHLEWLFALVGVLLAVILIIVSLARQYLTIAFLVAGLAALIFAAYWAMWRRAPAGSSTTLH
jgi:hypothetical protein